jgi:hypothetical protein
MVGQSTSPSKIARATAAPCGSSEPITTYAANGLFCAAAAVDTVAAQMSAKAPPSARRFSADPLEEDRLEMLASATATATGPIAFGASSICSSLIVSNVF